MGMMIRMALACFWLVPVPLLCGQMFFRNRPFAWPESILAGILFMFSAAEVLILPMTFLRLPLHVLTVCCAAVFLAGTAAGLIRLCRFYGKNGGRDSVSAGKHPFSMKHLFNRKEFSWYLLAAVLVILLQMAVVSYFGHFDQDDAFYVGAATTAVQTDTIFEISAYTGFPYRTLPKRYVLSPFPILLAVISRLSAGLHPAVLAHVVYAPVFVGAGYLALWLLARRFYPEEPDSRGIFLLLSALLYWFCGYASRNQGSFLLLRPWQGKAVLAGVLLPFLFYLCLQLFLPSGQKEENEPWFLLFLGILASCHVSTMGVLLAPLTAGIFMVSALLQKARPNIIWRTILCCLPPLALGIVYLIL